MEQGRRVGVSGVRLARCHCPGPGGG
jgi:hypothetical protein